MSAPELKECDVNNKRKGKNGRENKKNPEFKKKVPRYEKEKHEIESLACRYSCIDLSKVEKFTDLPISHHTMRGLSAEGLKDKSNEFTVPTDIQKQAITYALQDRDIIGAAKTGSGKTLAFLIPVLERLYCLRWTKVDGLGSLIISPTRELAFQTFNVLRRLGRFHDTLSAGLVIGGTKNVERERELMSTCNIIVCTPGRLLQHMDECPEFDYSSLKLLVLDEADRILETCFASQMNAIFDNLNSFGSAESRQTMLFSATQTKSVHDLARLSLHLPAAVDSRPNEIVKGQPVYLSVHENCSRGTPDTLKHECYVILKQSEKINVLHSFLKAHRSKKVLVFVASCKQVRFIHELLKKVRCPMQMLSLHGGQKQHKRIDIFNEFCNVSKSCVLIATDVAARGLDFPHVDWVYQMDCPESWKIYNHRVGRTARNNSTGSSIITFTERESEIVKDLEVFGRAKITKELIDPRKQTAVNNKLHVLCASDSEFLNISQRAFVAYIKSVHLMSDKKVFDVNSIDLHDFASSCGLAVTPRLRFLDKMKSKINKHSKESVAKDVEKQYNPLEINNAPSDCESEDEDSLFSVKRVDHGIDGKGGEKLILDHSKEEIISTVVGSKVITKASIAKRAQKRGVTMNDHIKFDNEIDDDNKEDDRNDSSSALDIDEVKERMRKEDISDKLRERELIRKRKQVVKQKKMRSKRSKKTDDDGLSSGPEDDDLSHVDLDWLPDPDKIYPEEQPTLKSKENKSDSVLVKNSEDVGPSKRKKNKEKVKDLESIALSLIQ